MWRHRRVLLIYYLFNLLAGVLLTIPWRGTLKDFIGSSLMGGSLAGKLDPHFLIEFFSNNSALSDILMSTFVVAGIIYWVGSLFLSGGAFHIFVHHTQYAPINFWGSAANNFGRFLRLFLWMIPVFLLLVVAPTAGLSGLQDLIFGDDAYESVLYWGSWLRLLLRFLGIVLCYLLFDYARIYIVQTGERSTRVALSRSFGFVFGNLRRTITLTFAVWLIGIILLLFYNPFSNWLSDPGTITITILFLMQQLFMLTRMALKLTLFAGEVSLFNALFFSK
ncbi:MAG: hypothetical protein KDH98_17540 [Calditrichaeota bacterium]|nr:hypothetical protein [Calditrichota bacterium]